MSDFRILVGDALEQLRTLPDESVQCCVTSPPYFGLRDYGIDAQLGLEPTPEAYVEKLVEVFREVRRVLRDDGTLWLNLGDSYISTPRGNRPGDLSTSSLTNPERQDNLPRPRGATSQRNNRSNSDEQRSPNRWLVPGLKPKDLVGIPWRVAFALQADGWWLRSDIVWSKPNPMPESVTDRPTKSHEYVFLLTKRARYFFDADAVREPVNLEYLRARWGGSLERTEGNGLTTIERSRPTGRTRTLGVGVGGRNIRSVWTIATQPFTGWIRTARLVRVEQGAPSDDTARITSPGCPVHAGRPDRVPTALRDERVADEWTRIFDRRDRLAKELGGGSEKTGPHPFGCSEDESSDCPRPPCVPSATHHSNRTHRTAPALATSQPCNASAQTSGRTDGTSTSRACDEPGHDTDESNTSEGSFSGETAPDVARSDLRSSDKCDCSCEMYTLKTEEMSHFAVFPEALVVPCIKAGTSEHGCCAECGAPWDRVVERTTLRDLLTDSGGVKPKQRGRREQGLESGCSGLAGSNNHGDMATCPQTKTTGWRPTCDCGTEARVPCVVLDPFAGSGTTGVVASKHGRDSIGIELNPEYAEMARRRIGDAPMSLFAPAGTA